MSNNRRSRRRFDQRKKAQEIIKRISKVEKEAGTSNLTGVRIRSTVSFAIKEVLKLYPSESRARLAISLRIPSREILQSIIIGVRKKELRTYNNIYVASTYLATIYLEDLSKQYDIDSYIPKPPINPPKE